MPTASVRPVGMAAVLLAAAILAGCSGGSSVGTSSPSTGPASTGPAATAGFDGAALPAGITAPGFELSDQQGRRVSLSDQRGQVVVVSFLYPTCGPVCTLVAQQIRGALDQLAGSPPAVLLISAEPAADTPANIARFLADVSLSRRVEYLTGSRSRLARLWTGYRITPPGVSRSDFERGASVLLIDRRGDERVVFGIEQLTPESLAHDIGKLQGEAGHP